MTSKRIHTLLLFSLISCTLWAQLAKDRYTVVLSMDAFRWDYPHIYRTPTLDSLAKVGVSARFVPCFPTITFPNHYSMATGLHPNNHGIVHNTFYDAELKRSYSLSDRSAVQDGVFYGGEPVWLTAHKQGLIAASYCWVGSEAPIQGYQPTPWKMYDGTPSFEARADSVISWLARSKESRPNLIMWYFEDPDAVSHHNTPFSNKTQHVVERLDSIVGDFMVKARQLPHFSQIDFVFVGDHGMSTYVPARYVNLADYLPLTHFSKIVSGAITHLYLKDRDFLNDALKALRKAPHCKVYAREKLPKRFSYGSNKRIGDIVVLADSASMVLYTNKSVNFRTAAAHGYDNTQMDMSAIFRAVGPSFRVGVQVQPMLNLNLYNIICRSLQIVPAPNDGDPKLLKQIFK